MTDTHIPPPGRRLSARSSRVALQLGTVLCLFLVAVGSLHVLGSRYEVHAGRGGGSGGDNGNGNANGDGHDGGSDGAIVVAGPGGNNGGGNSGDNGNANGTGGDNGNSNARGGAGISARLRKKQATADAELRKQSPNISMNGRAEGKIIPGATIKPLIDKILEEGAIPTKAIDTLTKELHEEGDIKEEPSDEPESEEPLVEETVPVVLEEIPLPNDPEPSASFPTHPTFRIDRSKTADISGEEFKDRLRLTLTRGDGAVSHPEFDLTGDGRHSVLTLDGSAFRPGRFTLTAVLLPHASVVSRTGRTAARTEQGGTRIQGGEELLVLEETFLWGVVGFNTDREVYAVGERATLSFSVLDDLGQPTCAQSLTLQVIGPVQNVRTYTVPAGTSEAELIEIPASCPAASTEGGPPVYRLTIPLGLVGTYAFTLDATTPAGPRQHADYVTVVETPPFLDIRRDALTLITGEDGASKVQTMQITVVPRYTFVGTYTETIPEGWDVSAVTPEFSQPTRATVAWQGRFEAGVPTVLTYMATRAPVIDATAAAYSEFVQFGPLTAEGILDNLFEPIVDPVLPGDRELPRDKTTDDAQKQFEKEKERKQKNREEGELKRDRSNGVRASESDATEKEQEKDKDEKDKKDKGEKEKENNEHQPEQEDGEAQETIEVPSRKGKGGNDDRKASLEPDLLAQATIEGLVQQRADERARVRALRRGETPLVRKPWPTTTVVIVHRELVAAEQSFRSDSAPSDAQFRSVEPRHWNAIVVGEPRAPVAETGSSALLILEPISETADYALTDSPAFVVVTPDGTDETEKKTLKEKLGEDLHDKKLDPIDHAEGRKHLLEALTSEEVTPVDAEREDLVTVSLISSEGTTAVDFSFEQASGTTVIVIEPDRTMTPGTYTLELTVKDPDTGQITTLTQNFTWGVLALNFDADRYLPGSRAAVAIGVLDDHGEIVCDAQVTLTVTSPSGAEQIRTTADGTIAVTGTCGIKDSMLTTPDYEARLTFEEEGDYTAVLEATTPAGTHSITATVPVAADPPMIIRRTAATRLYPIGQSPMEVEVRFLSDYSGTIEDTVPEGFAISDVSESGTVASASDGTTITWSGTWSQGETVTFTYLYDAPDISPEFYLVGPLRVQASTLSESADADESKGTDSHTELRSWQIANDAPPQSSDDSLVGYWKFDETSAGTFADSSGGAHNGTGNGAGGANNTPQPSSDVPPTSFGNGRSLDYDGIDDYVETTIPAITYPFSISGWFKTSNTVNEQAIAVPGSAGSYAIGLYLFGGAVEALTFNGDLDRLLSDTYSANIWHHAAAVWVSSTERYVYLDGVQSGGTGRTSIDRPTDSQTLGIGAGKFANVYSEFNPGLIDDVRIYNRALSAAEIADLAAGRHTTAIWDGSSSTNFETAFNWNTDAVPDPYTHIIAKRSGSGSPVLAATISGASLTIEADGSLDLHGYNFEFNDAGTLKGGGTLKLLGSESIQNLSNVATTSTGTVLYYGTGSYTGLAAGSSYNNLTINDGLVGYWKLDDTSGVRAVDSSGHGNSGTLIGGATISTTVAPTNFTNARSLSFDGTDDYVNVPHHSTLDIANGNRITMSTWVKWNGNSGGDGYYHVVGRDNATGALDGAFVLFIKSDNQMAAYLVKTANADYINVDGGGTAVSIGVWHHLAVTWDGTTIMTYIDGVLNQSSVVAKTWEGSANYPLTIGRSGAASRPFNGSIDDVRIYNRALSAQEIQSLAAGSHPSSSSGTYTLGSNLAVEGDLTVNAGNLDVSGSNYGMAIAGSLINNGGKITPRKGTITLDGSSGGKQIQTGGQRLNALTIENTGVWTMQDRLMMSGSLTLNAGTLDVGSGSYAIHAQTLSQSNSSATSTIIPRAGNIILNGSTNQTVIATSTLNSLRIEDPTENGLVGYWKLDEMTGLTARDSSPSGNNGTLTNGPAWSGSSLNTGVQFVNSGALKFDGTDDYVDAGTGLNQAASFSVGTWFKTSSDGIALVDKNGNATTNYRLQVGVVSGAGTANKLSFSPYFATSGVATLTSSASVNDNAWHHAVSVYDQSANLLYLYLDGALAAGPASGGVGTLGSSGDKTFIGARGSGTDPVGSYWNGLLDDVRIYNRALSANEVVNLYRGRYAAGGNSTATFTLGGNLSTTALSIDSGILDTSTRTVTVTNALQLLRGNGSLTHGSSTLTLNGGLTLSGSTLTGGAGTIDVNGAVSILTGSLIAPSGTMTVSGHFLMSGGMLNANGGTLTFDGSGEQTLRTLGTGDDQDFATVTVNKSAGSLTLAGNAFSGSALNVTSGTFSPGALAATVGALTINGGTFTGAGGNLDLNGTLILSSGTLTAPSGAFTVAGDWTKSGGTFTPGSNTVTLDGGNQAINGSTTFYNLTKATTAAATLTFQAGETQTITNTLSLTGAVSNLLSLRSSQTGTAWNINPQGTRSVQYLDVKDSNNTNAAVIDCVGLNCTDSGNNTNWKFVNEATGISAAYRKALRDRRQAAESQAGATEGAVTTPITETLPPSIVAERNAERLLARETDTRKAIERFIVEKSHPQQTVVTAPLVENPPKIPASPAGRKAPTRPMSEPVHEMHGKLAVVIGEQMVVYRDVSMKDWFAPYVAIVAQKGVAVGATDATGKPRGAFNPAAFVSFAEIAKMAIKTAGLDEFEVATPPKNPSAQTGWASRFIAIAEQAGFSLFRSLPNVERPATRGEIIQTILEAMGIPVGARPGQYTDLPASHPQSNAISTATYYGIISGDTDAAGNPTGTVRPDEQVTRAEVAKMLATVLTLFEK